MKQPASSISRSVAAKPSNPGARTDPSSAAAVASSGNVAAPTKGLRRFLYLTAAVAGAAVMVVEILGAKMLSPYVGMSHFVWTAQIAVTLMALAAGYYTGGRLADRSQKLAWLYWAILGAALYLALTVAVCEPIAYWCLDFRLAVGSLMASALLFFVPLALLAMTGPFLVRMITSSVSGVGGNVGRLTAVSTLGSFAGTMLIGYVMVPLLPNSVTMFITALALMLLSAIYFTVYRRLATPVALFAVTIAGGFLFLHQSAKREYSFVAQRFLGNSHFGELRVVDRKDGSCRYYMNDNLIQNTYDPARQQSASAFTYLLAGLAQAYTTNIHDALCIGLGVGIVPRELMKAGANVDVVEINPAITNVAVRFFDLPIEKIHVTIDDGRHYLNRCRKQYDAVVLDAFLGDSSPSHLLTREAFASIKRVLRPDGVLVINCFASVEEGKDYFGASLERTLKAVFPGVRLHTGHRGAIFYVATVRPDPVFERQPDLADVHPEAKEDTQAAYSGLVEAQPGSGRVLTDNYNPIEFYDARNREELRRRLARGAREM